MTTVDPTARYLEPRGFDLAILVVNMVFLALAIIFVGVRACVRFFDRKFSLDDGFMVAGTIAYAGQIGLSSWSCFTGLGTSDSEHNDTQLAMTKMIYIIWVIVYNLTLALVKSGICLTMHRIFTYQAKYVRIITLILLGVTWAAFIIAFIGIMAGCEPLSANWSNATTGNCSSKLTLATLTYIITATALFTDLAIVILNAAVLWKTMMSRSSKIQVFCFMSFASFASFFAIIRTVFLVRLSSVTDFDTTNRGEVKTTIWLGYIILFSNMENGAGCLLSSLPSIRRLFSRSPSGSSADAAADTSSYDRRASDRKFSQPLFRNHLLDNLTTIELLQTVNEVLPKAAVIERCTVDDLHEYHRGSQDIIKPPESVYL